MNMSLLNPKKNTFHSYLFSSFFPARLCLILVQFFSIPLLFFSHPQRHNVFFHPSLFLLIIILNHRHSWTERTGMRAWIEPFMSVKVFFFALFIIIRTLCLKHSSLLPLMFEAIYLSYPLTPGNLIFSLFLFFFCCVRLLIWFDTADYSHA